MSEHVPAEGPIKLKEDSWELALVQEHQKELERHSMDGDEETIIPPDSEEPGSSTHVIQPKAEPHGTASSTTQPISTHCMTSARRQDPLQPPTPQPVTPISSSSSSSSGGSSSSSPTSTTDDASLEEMDKDTLQSQQEQNLILKDIRSAMQQVAHTIRLRHMELTKVNASLLRVLQDNATIRRDMAAMGRDMAAQNNRITSIQGDILGVQHAMKDMITRVSEIITIQAQAAVAAMFPFSAAASEEGVPSQSAPETTRQRLPQMSVPPTPVAASGLRTSATLPPPTTVRPPSASYTNARDRRLRQGKASLRADKPYARGRGGWGRGNGM